MSQNIGIYILVYFQLVKKNLSVIIYSLNKINISSQYNKYLKIIFKLLYIINKNI